MKFPTEQLRLYVLTRHKTGAAAKYIIHKMTPVHGKDNVPSQNTVYCWIQDIKMEYGLAKKGAKKLRVESVPFVLDKIRIYCFALR